MKALSFLIRSVGSRELGLFLVSALLLSPGLLRATDPYWINSGTITSLPQIDASNFVNSGSINIASELPFETSDTINFTNSGTMVSSPGWFFDTAAASNGPRDMADNFVNLNGGIVQSLDGGFVIVVGGGTAGSVAARSYLWVNASNVVNHGILSVGGSGWMRIISTNVDVARGALEVTALQPRGSFNGQSNYLNDVGITDIYWGQTNGFGFSSANVYNGTRATAPPHQVQRGPGGPFQNVSFSVNQPLTYGYSNTTDFAPITITNADGSTTDIQLATNIIKQAVFIGDSNPSLLSSAVTFFPSTSITNPFRTVCIQLGLLSTNVITQQQDQTTIYFYDTLASETNRGLLQNLTSTALPPFVDQKPANYLLSRIDDGRFFSGNPGNATPTRTYLYDPTTYSNSFVVGEYSGYAAMVDNLATEPPPVTPGTVTNFPGRVQVYADNLDFGFTRVRGEGEVVVKANHLLSSDGAAVDCENLSYTLGSTNGNLHFANLSKQSVLRLKGNLFAWSGLWSNQLTVVLTNNFSVTNTMDTNGVITGTNSVPSPLTNTVFVGLHALILDATRLAAQVPVITWDLHIHSTNIVFSDTVSVVQNLLLDGVSFTLDGGLNLTSTTLQNTFGQSATTALYNFINTNAPKLLYFTNLGTFTAVSEAHFGDDRPIPYADFVNTGTLSAGSINVNSGYIENDGSMDATVGPLNLVGNSAKFQNGSTISSGDLNLSFSDVKFLNHRLTATGALNLNAPDALTDAGASSANVFTARNGFNLLKKPNTGDLLGTTFQDSPPNFILVSHTWAGQDRGSSPAGYSDNTAVGKLVLTIQSVTPAQFPLFSFRGAGAQNGLYVDLLDLTSLGTNYLALLQINPSLTIYYAAAKVGFTPPPNSSGIPQEPEEFLNGQFGGHLVWVSSFAGPNSSTAVLVNGQTVLMNTALRNSKIIDSDGDGIPNFFDTTPLGGSGGTPPSGLVLGPGLVNRPSGQPVFSLSWNASANTAYRVEMTTDLAHPNWQLVTTYNNTSPTTTNVTISDTNNVSGRQRFYRVRVVP
jgi:hypothetical protein